MTSQIKIFHNPKCSKSRLTVELLNQKGLQTDIIEYLKSPPDKQQLNDILKMLNMQPRQLMRTHEAEYKENNLANESLTHDQLIEAMIKFPKLIERPIVINKNKAAIGRPPENVLEIL